MKPLMIMCAKSVTKKPTTPYQTYEMLYQSSNLCDMGDGVGGGLHTN